jgi:molybdate transport system substrate-binding protein
MKPKIKIAQGGRGAMELLAKGEVDIGLTFISEIITEPGVEVAGPLPRDISTPTALVAFVSTHSKEPEAAQALLRYLSSAEAATVYKKRGMQPVAERWSKGKKLFYDLRSDNRGGTETANTASCYSTK